MSGATRQEVLGLYRKVLRIARRWQSQSGLDKDSDVERKYICQEARNLFKQNRNITDPQLIKNCIEECNARIEIGIHIRVILEGDLQCSVFKQRLSQTEQPSAMRESEGTSMSSEMQQLQNRFTSLLNNLKRNSKIVELMKSPLGQYLDSHPFLALVLLVFIVMATLPTALFLSFAVISFVVTSVGFILLEGVLVLLCVLCSLSIIAFSVTAILSAFYVLTSNVVNQYQIQRTNNFVLALCSSPSEVADRCNNSQGADFSGQQAKEND
ncbi:LYRM1 protein, partial [Polypterus senegalus]